jgi:hypothetical protein
VSTTTYQEDTMTTARKTRSKRVEFTPEQKEQYRKEQRELGAELMKQGINELLTSEGWQKWAAMRARLHTYSFANTMLILAQMPEATFVASGKFWNDHKRMMLKGTQSLKVWAPLFRRPSEAEIAAGRRPEDKVLYSYKLVPVFDISQTDGEPLPVLEVQSIEGDSHAAYLRPLEVFAHTLGYSVSYEDLSGDLNGYCDAKHKHIAINKARPVNSQVRTLIHEIAHALGFGYKEYGREQCEVLVETAAFIVATSIGLDTSDYSIPYAAGWGEANAVAAIEKFAGEVDAVARQIERAVKEAEVAT